MVKVKVDGVALDVPGRAARLVPMGIAALVAGAFVPQHAAAQTAAQERSEPSSAADIRGLHDYAQCVATAQPRRARALLAMDYREPEYQEVAFRLYGPEPGCWRHLGDGRGRRAADVRFNARMFAARMAERFLRTDLAGSTLAARVAHDPARPAIQARSEDEVMSLCTVRAAPAQVAALFASTPASRDETSAINALTPHIGACLRAGATGEFNRPAIRSMLGLAAYRLVQHNMAASAPATEG